MKDRRDNVPLYGDVIPAVHLSPGERETLEMCVHLHVLLAAPLRLNGLVGMRRTAALCPSGPLN